MNRYDPKSDDDDDDYAADCTQVNFLQLSANVGYYYFKWFRLARLKFS